jgi:hypothetical protein
MPLYKKAFLPLGKGFPERMARLSQVGRGCNGFFCGDLKGTSGNLLWKWGAEKIPAGEAINAKLSGDSWCFSNEDSGDFIKLQPA